MDCAGITSPAGTGSGQAGSGFSALSGSSAASAHVLGKDGRNLLLGFSPDQKSMMEILGTQTNRKFLEMLLSEITATDWTVKLSVKDGLAAKHPKVGKLPAESGVQSFKDDPLIQEALEMFKGEIKS